MTFIFAGTCNFILFYLFLPSKEPDSSVRLLKIEEKMSLTLRIIKGFLKTSKDGV